MAGCMLVLGGSGTLGAPLCARAEARGWDVIATYVTQPDRIRAGLPVQLDLRDRAALHDLVISVAPDVIVHAAITERSGPEHDTAIRIAAQHVADIAVERTIRLVALSTDLVFDGGAPFYDEDSPLCPSSNNPYAQAKADMERTISARYPAALIVRTSLIYDFDPTNAQVVWMLRAIERGETLRLFTNQMRCPIWVANLADALLELAAMDVAGVLHVVGPQLISRYALGVALLDALGYDAARHVEAARAPDTAPRALHLSVERARALLKRTPLLAVAQARARWETEA